MLDAIDRLLGRQPAQKAVVTGTGGTGPGVLAYGQDIPLWSASRNPRKLMRQAQALYHEHPWVHAAEHRVSSTAAGVQWHLEDENDDEVTDESAPELVAIRDLLEQPQALLPIKAKKTTRRGLWQVTFRHEGLCGNGFWYLDERDALYGIPRSLLYINPARMWPVYDPAGNATSWKLDTDDEGNGGIPIDLDEVLQFELDPPDVGAWGIGIVESAGRKAQLSQLGDKHMANVLGSGGRLAGLVSPKQDNSNTDGWDGFVRDWRNIAQDPDAAKRLQISKIPIDFTRTSGTPSELEVVNVAKMTREDVFGLWGVPLSQQGVSTAAGMNSGDTKGYDEAVLWQGPVHARIVPFRERIQYGLLDEIARRGGPRLELVIEEPEFDDETPLYDRAQKAIDQPLTTNERRAILGLDPLPDYDLNDEPLGTAIYLPGRLTLFAAGPGEDGKLKPLPEPPPPPPTAPGPLGAVAVPVPPPTGVPATAAKARPLLGLRHTVDTRYVASTKRDVQKALNAQAKAVANRVRSRGSADMSTGSWWDEKAEDTRLRRAIEPHNIAIAETVTQGVEEMLGKPKKADTFADTVATYVRDRTAERVLGINATTRDLIAKLIADGFAQGLGPSEVADNIEAATAFDEARAELVARTESMLAYNEASLTSYQEFGVTEVEALDGDEDQECAERNGKVYPVEEAFSVFDHPNGTLDWAPVI